MSERRSYIRHPVEVPIQIFPQQGDALEHSAMSDVGEGGVAFQTNVAFEPGTRLRVKVPHVQPLFDAEAVVCWCAEQDGAFEVGVRFLDAESRFRARMVEQVCHIEDYRQKNSRAGRQLSAEQSASEWISRYAAGFGGR